MLIICIINGIFTINGILNSDSSSLHTLCIHSVHPAASTQGPISSPVSTQGSCPQHLPSVYKSLLIFLCSAILLFFLTSSNQYLLHVSMSLTFWFLNEWEHMVVIFCVWFVSLNKVTSSSIHNTLWLSSIPLYKHTVFSLTFHPAKGRASGYDSVFQLLWTVLAKLFRHNFWEPDHLRPNGQCCYHWKINQVLFSSSFWEEKKKEIGKSQSKTSKCSRVLVCIW